MLSFKNVLVTAALVLTGLSNVAAGKLEVLEQKFAEAELSLYVSYCAREICKIDPERVGYYLEVCRKKGCREEGLSELIYIQQQQRKKEMEVFLLCCKRARGDEEPQTFTEISDDLLGVLA